MPIVPPPVAPSAVETVVVQSARLPQAAGDAAFSVIELDPAVLANSQRLDGALAETPGFSLFRRTSSLVANPTNQGFSLRGVAGSGTSRALVTLDGVPQNDSFGGWMIWTGLPTEAIGNATLVRGAGAGAYGAAALTGVVALESPTEINSGLDGDVEGGELGYERAAGVAEFKPVPATRVFLDASGESSQGLDISRRAGRRGPDRTACGEARAGGQPLPALRRIFRLSTRDLERTASPVLRRLGCDAGQGAVSLRATCLLPVVGGRLGKWTPMQTIDYSRHRFPAEVIRYAVWLYFRFTLSLRDVEELLAERGIEVSYETIRCWTLKFGPQIA